MSNGIEHGETATVEKNGKELEVYDHISVANYHYVNSINGYETFEPDIVQGDMPEGPKPNAVTKRIADLLYSEWSIEVENHDIEVVDMSDDDIEVL